MLSLHSFNEPSELLQWPSHDDSTMNIIVIIDCYYNYCSNTWSVLLQKEHSNLITNLRATNEPAVTVACGERVPVITETRDHDLLLGAAQSSVVSGSSIRQRRKIERNTSAPLPGMLQVNS